MHLGCPKVARVSAVCHPFRLLTRWKHEADELPMREITRAYDGERVWRVIRRNDDVIPRVLLAVGAALHTKYGRVTVAIKYAGRQVLCEEYSVFSFKVGLHYGAAIAR